MNRLTTIFIPVSFHPIKIDTICFNEKPKITFCAILVQSNARLYLLLPKVQL